MFDSLPRMRRRLHHHPVLVRLVDDRPILFWLGEREYEVIGVLKMVGLIRLDDDVDTRLWQVRARSAQGLEATYELECDHGKWSMIAIWD